MKTEPNQSAFGYGFTTANGESHVNESGLSKREYFAAKAMEAFCNAEPNASSESMARWSVEAADSLIKELNKES